MVNSRKGKTCEICKRNFNILLSLQRHFSQAHKITSKEYYDTYLKKDDEGICYCGEKTRYKNISIGYHEFCSTKCVSNDKDILDRRRKLTEGNNHWTRRCGKGPNKGKTYEEIHGLEKSEKLKANLSNIFSKRYVGENNPFFGRKHTSENMKKYRTHKLGKTYEEMYGKEKAEIIKNKQRKEIKPKNYHTEYDAKFFDVGFRQQILKEQTYLCGICLSKLKGRYKKNLHHINYIKKDNRRRNVIYLCVSCHTKTNYNRILWKKYLRLLNAELLRGNQLSRKIIFRVKKKLNLKQKNLLLDSGGY